MSVKASVEPLAREGSISATIDSKVFIWGGELAVTEDTSKDTSHLKNLYILDALRETWTSRPFTGEHPQGFKYCSSTQSGNVLYVYGGFNKQNQTTGSLFSLNLDLALWRELSPHVPHGPWKKSGSGMVVHGEKIIIFGGYTEDQQVTNELHVFDISTSKNSK